MADPKKVFASGEKIFEEGAVASSLFFIKKGAVSLKKREGISSVEHEVGKAIANQVIGELPFFDHGLRTETAVAMSYVEAIEIPYSVIEQVYTKVPDYLKSIMACMASRLQTANELIHSLNISNK
jgi:CRP-like cAMP-binding protein